MKLWFALIGLMTVRELRAWIKQCVARRSRSMMPCAAVATLGVEMSACQFESKQQVNKAQVVLVCDYQKCGRMA